MSVYIIAEIGINHSGSRVSALDLMKAAKRCGADMVKFQRRNVDVVYSPAELAKPRESPWGTTTGHQKRGLELSWEDYDFLWAQARELEIEMFWSCWDIGSLVEIERRYKPRFQKIASAMLAHLDFCEMVSKLKHDHTFISTGMSDYDEIDPVVDMFLHRGRSFTLMHCIGWYPCPDPSVNVRMVETLRQRYPGVPIGYSSHDVGLLPSILAVALGATSVEKHITLDRASYGSDQAASMEPGGFERLVRECRAVESCLGDGVKRVLPEELQSAKKLRYWRANG